LLSIPVAAFLHHLHIVHLFITAFLCGILGFLFDIAYISYLPSIVESDKLIEANSRLSATASVAEVAGFGLGGWLVQLLTAPIAIVIDSISFFISAVFVGTIKRKEDSPSRIDEGVSVVEENIEGLKQVLSLPVLRAITISTLLQHLSIAAFFTLIILFVTRDLGIKPGIQGVIYAMRGVSSLSAAMLATRSTRVLVLV